MRLSLHRLLRTLLLGSLLAAGLGTPARAQEAAPAPVQDEESAARVARFKQAQIRFMNRGAQRRATRYATRVTARKVAMLKAAPPATKGAGVIAGVTRRAPRMDPDPPRDGSLGVQGAQSPASPAAIATNRLVNNRATDTAICNQAPCTGLPWSGQCEVSIAANGNNVVAAWNDGEGFVGGTSTQGYAYSTNGGVTWVDGGVPPVSGGVTEWTSDPVVTVNEKTGAFYYAGLCDPSGTTNGIGVIKGTFVGGVLTWQTPRVVVSGTNSTVIYDKEWLVADSTSTNLYMVYARFTVSGGSITSNRIEFTRNTNDNALPWTSPVQISAAGDNGGVQGPRVAVGPGPAADVWTAWNVIGPSFDYMKVRKLTLGGTILSAEQTAATQYTNFGTGAPGFNRGTGFAFPGLAIDRSTSPRRGRAFLIWNESVNFYNDNFGITTVAESEPNNTPGTADPFNLGQKPTGTISSSTDFDYWSFNGTAGQTIICEYDGTASPTLDPSFRLFCSDGTTRMGYSEPGPGGTGLIVFTLPTNATYTLRVAPFAGTGSYTISTVANGAVTERARDHRDVFTTFSDNYTTWSTPVRVNGDAALYDDWLPEIAVAGDGVPYATWYDWRDSPAGTCGGSSMIYLSRSSNGGASWPDGSPVSEVVSPWTTTYSNIAPNQGDYVSLFANNNLVYVCWSDGRNGDPDVYMAAVSFLFTPVLVSVADTHVEPGLVRVTWYTADAAVHTATVYRRTADGVWSERGTVSPDGGGQMVFEDREVQAGTRYDYRLGVMEGTQETFTGEVTVDVPANAELAIDEVRPNPTEREMWVSFSLPDNRPASLELIDVTGRRVRERTVTGAGRQTVDLAAGRRLPPGIYLIRLTHNGQTTVKRASVVR
jgi:type IX secretion system substrate protein